jgi:RND family efflux transporter MFP subunit
MIAKRGILRLIALAALVAGGWFAFQFSAVPTVTVTPVRRGDALLSATGNVKVVPAQDGRVVAPAQGILIKFSLKQGDMVKKGDVIAEIDRGNYPFLLAENRIGLDRVEQLLTQGSPDDIELDKEKKTFAKNLELANSGGIPAEMIERDRRDIERLELKIRQERSELEYRRATLKNKVAEIQQEIDRRTVRAGYDGVVMAPAVLQGDQVFNGGGLCNLTSLNKALTAEVNQDDLDAVNQCRKEKKPVLVRLFSQGETVFTGTVADVIPVGDPKTGRFTVNIEVPDLPATVLSGQTGEATFIAGKHENALLIPRKALNGGECLVLKGDRLQQRKVKVGYTTVTEAEILEGLNEADLVVAQDVDLYRDNEKVKVKDTTGKDAGK